MIFLDNFVFTSMLFIFSLDKREESPQITSLSNIKEVVTYFIEPIGPGSPLWPITSVIAFDECVNLAKYFEIGDQDKICHGLLAHLGNLQCRRLFDENQSLKKLLKKEANETESKSTKEWTPDHNETKVEKSGADQNQMQTKATENQNQTQTKKEFEIKTIKEPIETSVNIIDSPPLSEDLFKESKEKLKNLDNKEIEKLNRDTKDCKAKNTLESFILETRIKLQIEDYSSSITQDEKTNIQTQLSSVSLWLEYESDGAQTNLFNDKLADLKSLTRNLFDRVREHRERPEILNSLRNFINISRVFYASVVDDQVFTEVELQTLKKLIDDTNAWMETSVAEQNKLPRSQAPKLTVKSIAEKIGGLDRKVKYLLNIEKIRNTKFWWKTRPVIIRLLK